MSFGRRERSGRHWLARALLIVLGASSLLTERGQAWPAFERVFTPALFGPFSDIVAVFDFNRDGRQDLLVGGDRRLSKYCGNPDLRPLPPALRVLMSNGDGTFRDGTSEVIDRSPDTFFNPAWAFGTVGDFNNDGRGDFAVFDVGVECGDIQTGHTITGYPPILLLSTGDRWRTSEALARSPISTAMADWI